MHASFGSCMGADSAFTLVELMVVIAIMSVLASMVLFAMAGATESAKAAKTKSTINKINAVIMAKYESYRTRRLPVNIEDVTVYYATLSGSDPYRRGLTPAVQSKSNIATAMVRLDVIRDLMRMEMPDSFKDFDDIVTNSVKRGDPITQWKDASGQIHTMTMPTEAQNYRSILKAAQQLAQVNGLD
ncbi:MAG TPA: type II secretion system protein, partial [Pirellulales bacterium]